MGRGFFEGEGCINVQRQDGHVYGRLVMWSTDLDALERFHQIVDLGKIYAGNRKKEKPHHKDQWQWCVSGFERTQAVIVMLWPWLCERRKECAREVLLEVRCPKISKSEL
jgi:hypothetical protein